MKHLLLVSCMITSMVNIVFAMGPFDEASNTKLQTKTSDVEKVLAEMGTMSDGDNINDNINPVEFITEVADQKNNNPEEVLDQFTPEEISVVDRYLKLALGDKYDEYVEFYGKDKLIASAILVIIAVPRLLYFAYKQELTGKVPEVAILGLSLYLLKDRLASIYGSYRDWFENSGFKDEQ